MLWRAKRSFREDECDNSSMKEAKRLYLHMNEYNYNEAVTQVLFDEKAICVSGSLEKVHADSF